MRRFLSILIGIGLLLGILATSIFWTGAGEPPSSTTPAPNAGNIFMPVPGQVLAHDSVEPTTFIVGSIRAKVVPVIMDGSTLTPPSNPLELGWWGRRAGSKHGTTLLVGHTVHTGGGALDHLGDVPVGTVASVSGIRYRVVQNAPVDKPTLAKIAPKLFHQGGSPELVVVTCTGYDENTGEYSSNEVLLAKPIY